MATLKRASRRSSRQPRNAGPRAGTAALRTQPRALAYAVGTALLPWALLGYADPAANTVPTGGQFVAGSGTMGTAQSGSFSSGGNTYGTQLQVNQTSNAGIINWNTFSIGAGAWVNFSQPSSSSVTLNNVLSSNPSEIFGRLTSNGQIFLSNPYAVYFAPGASVEVG